MSIKEDSVFSKKKRLRVTFELPVMDQQGNDNEILLVSRQNAVDLIFGHAKDSILSNLLLQKTSPSDTVRVVSINDAAKCSWRSDLARIAEAMESATYQLVDIEGNE
jgi:hypothetical protein